MFNRIALGLAGLIGLMVAGVIAYSALTPHLTPAVEASGLALPNSQASADTSGITVSGSGVVRVKPNIATTSIGVDTTAATLADATSQSNTKMTAIISQIKSQGVLDKDIQTTSYNVSPITNQPKQGESPKITGYRVTNQVNVTIRKIDDVGKILDAAVAAGANNVYGISFSVDDPTTYQQQARAAAVKDALDKAGQLAKAAGVTLGKVISINESGLTPRPVFRAAAPVAGLADSSVPVETGEMQITISVDMRFGVQ